MHTSAGRSGSGRSSRQRSRTPTSRCLQVADSVAFNVAVEDILARADKEGRNPTAIPMGYLAERSEVKGGHTFTRFYGRPSAWMNQFAPTGKRVRRIIERSDGGASRTLYERA